MSLKVVLKTMVALLMMAAKTVTLGLLNTMVFWKEGYSITNRILSRDSKYVVDEVLCSKTLTSKTLAFLWEKFWKHEL